MFVANSIVEVIQLMLAPGLMISACGLLLLGMNNKYSKCVKSFGKWYAILIPLLFIVGLIWLPFIRFAKEYKGIWFFNNKGKKLVLLATIISCISVIIAVVISEFIIDVDSWFPEIPQIIGSGLIPFSFIIGLFIILLYFIKKRFNTNRSEFVLFVMTFLMVAYFIFSIVGIFFRGPGMQLMWPWHIN